MLGNQLPNEHDVFGANLSATIAVGGHIRSVAKQQPERKPAGVTPLIPG